MNSAILNAGPPPLTVDAADAALDLIDFMAAVVRGIDLIEVTPAVREAWHYHLGTHYGTLGPADRNWFANVAPQTWEQIRAQWSTKGDDEKLWLKQAWTGSISSLLQWVEPVLHPTPKAPVGGGQQFVYQPNPGYSSQEARGDSNPFMRQIIENHRKDEEEAAKTSPELAAQVRAQNQATIATILTGMAQMGFQTALNTAKNMKY